MNRECKKFLLKATTDWKILAFLVIFLSCILVTRDYKDYENQHFLNAAIRSDFISRGNCHKIEHEWMSGQ